MLLRTAEELLLIEYEILLVVLVVKFLAYLCIKHACQMITAAEMKSIDEWRIGWTEVVVGQWTLLTFSVYVVVHYFIFGLNFIFFCFWVW